jgi:hypothetical protein
MIKKFSASRRRLLIGASAAAVGCATVGAASWSYSQSHRARWIEAVVRNNLPGVRIDAVSLQRFVKEMLASPLMQSQRRRIGIAAYSQLPWLARRIRTLEEGVEITERLVLTAFLTGSNFFRVGDPKRETIEYYGGVPACGNPFVRLS